MTRSGRRLLVLGAGVAVVAGAGVGVALASGGSGPVSDPSAGAATVSSAGTATGPAWASATGAPSMAAPGAAGPPDAGGAAGASTTPSSTAVPGTPSGAAPALATTSPAGRLVQVGLGYSDWDAAGKRVEAAGFVSGVVESGGTCTLSLTDGTRTVQATSTGQADATTTNCGSLMIPGAQVPAGRWTATLSYRSNAAHGTSPAATVTVPAR